MSLSPLQRQYLRLLDIDVWQARDAQFEQQAEAPVVAASTGENTDEDAQWQQLVQQVATCTQCQLHRGRKQTVFGTGARDADWLLVGEAPGAEEDRRGEPFVGSAGKLLNAMLAAMELQRSQVYIANVVKCRPPNNRDPLAEEMGACADYLRAQISLLRPKIILALGRVAAQHLLQVDTPIGKMRGQRYHYPGTEIPLLVTYHPGYLLRTPREKRKSWQDLQMAMQLYASL